MNVFDAVKDFHKAFGLIVGDKPNLEYVSESERDLRFDLLAEEFDEYMQAEKDNDIVEIADALADIIYIACGTAVAYGIPLEKVFKEVHESNMAKLVNGKVVRRSDGKILKPDGWKAPDIKKIIDNSL